MNNLYVKNLKDSLFFLKSDIIKEILKSKSSTTDLDTAHNFQVESKYKAYLYNIFISTCKNLLNNFSLSNERFWLWSYYTDKNYTHTQYHNHQRTSTINGVIYIQTVKNCGIEFIDEDNKVCYFEPKEFDLLIFPNYVQHKPIPSKNKTRISLNLELECNEAVEDIFKNEKTKVKLNYAKL